MRKKDLKITIHLRHPLATDAVRHEQLPQTKRNPAISNPPSQQDTIT
jgi:hypothetical protein